MARAEIGRFDGFLKPYVQGLIGTKRIATDISVYDESENGWFDDDDGKITSSTALEDWVFSYGGGLGFHIKIGRKTFLNLGANYIIGGNADYYTTDDIKNFDITYSGDGSNYNPNDPNLDGDDINLNTEPTNSETSFLLLQIGLNFILAKD